MSKIKIMTDSSVQLTPEEIKKYDITVVPLSTRSKFVELMNESEALPKTSQPPIGRFVETIKNLTADGSKVIGIFLAKALSGTVDAARQAAEIAGKSDDVYIIDSELTDRAEGFQVLKAAKDAQAGKSVDEIIEDINKINCA